MEKLRLLLKVPQAKNRLLTVPQCLFLNSFLSSACLNNRNWTRHSLFWCHKASEDGVAYGSLARLPSWCDHFLPCLTVMSTYCLPLGNGRGILLAAMPRSGLVLFTCFTRDVRSRFFSCYSCNLKVVPFPYVTKFCVLYVFVMSFTFFRLVHWR